MNAPTQTPARVTIELENFNLIMRRYVTVNRLMMVNIVVLCVHKDTRGICVRFVRMVLVTKETLSAQSAQTEF